MTQYSDTEISEAAQNCIAAIIRMGNNEFVSQFINKLGKDKKVMPNAHYQAAYRAVLSVFQSSQPINALSVWDELEGNKDFQGGIDEMMKLHTLVVEGEASDIFTNYFPYCKVLTENYADRQNAARAMRIGAVSGADLDRVILDEADRIIAERRATAEISEAEDYVQFPEHLLFDVFKPYAAAFQGKTEVPLPFHFAVLKTVIGASLGRRVYLDEIKPLYPNFYSVIIGETGLARKSTALRLGEKLLRDADPSVYTLRGLATPEGLLQVFVPPSGYSLGSSIRDDDEAEAEGAASLIGDQLEFMLDNAEPGVEGFRVLVSLDEFSYLLKKATKPHGEGLIQMLTEAYDYTDKLDLPTRVNPISADHPCLSMIAATTMAWLEASLKLEDIQGGFANRISYYYATTDEFVHRPEPGDSQFLDVVKYSVNQFRQKFLQPTAFSFSEVADNEFKAWYINHRKGLKTEQNPLVREALARTDTHMRKAALLHAAISNDADDCEIGLESLKWAITLAEYLQAVTTQIYSKFNLSEERRLEQRIIDVLEQKPNQTARELTQRISWASAKEVNTAVEELVKNGTVAKEEAGRTTKYHVLREI